MLKQISPKIICLIFAVLVICFSLGFYVFAWTDKLVPTPLNVSDTDQVKLGSLTFSGLYDIDNNTYYINPSASPSAVFFGSVGIKTVAPNYDLDVSGQVNAAELCIAGDCRDTWPLAGILTKTIEVIKDATCDAEIIIDPESPTGYGTNTLDTEERCTMTFVNGALTETTCE